MLICCSFLFPLPPKVKKYFHFYIDDSSTSTGSINTRSFKETRRERFPNFLGSEVSLALVHMYRTNFVEKGHCFVDALMSINVLLFKIYACLHIDYNEFGEQGGLPDGRFVAVKKLNGSHGTKGAEEFLTEVNLLTSVRHRNLVRLFGCCTRGNERLLVYEFMSNNGLHKHLFGEMRNGLNWENRVDIIVGTARGLSYLHEDSNMRIIHRDIKCANILLDDRFHPKIADFGMARFFPDSETHVSTRIGGTIGYMAPEYAVHGQLTEKADVYSYGIVVLEIVTGRKCADVTLPEPMRILLEWVWNNYKQGNVLDIVDPKLEGQYPREQVLRVITIALLCTQGSWGQRPAMSQVVSMLTTDIEIRVQPTQPAFIDATADRPASSAATTNSKTSTSATTSRPVSTADRTYSGNSTSAAPSPQSCGSMTVSLFPR